MTYSATMLTAVLRLLTLAALALMPFGMGAASAGPAHHAPAAAGAGHCDEQGGQPAEDPAELAGCAAACSMFIAAAVPAVGPFLAIAQAALRPLAADWTSLPPETATPPPKRA